jgi:hypothetical protein
VTVVCDYSCAKQETINFVYACFCSCFKGRSFASDYKDVLKAVVSLSQVQSCIFFVSAQVIRNV